MLGGPASTFTSGRAYRRPGWAFVSSTTRPLLYATRLGDGATEYFADARLMDPVDYWAQPQGVPSPTGTRVLFATNWGQGAPDDRDAASFVADFRAACR